MTPFGIRKRVRSLLGGGRDTAAPAVSHTVTFILPDGSERTVEAEDRYNLLMASQALPAPIANGRRAGGPCPDGGCDLCRVEVLDTTGISPRTDFEQKVMEAGTAGEPHEGRARKPAPPIGPKTRLACHARVVGSGGRVKVHALVDFDALQGEEDGL